MTASGSASASPQSSTWRVFYALLASATRFVPVPFLDDLLRERVVRLMVLQTLRAHGRDYQVADVKPLFAPSGSALRGCLILAVKAPFKLLLFPIRKLVAVLRVARNLSLDLTEMLLLGRAVDRCVAAGLLDREVADRAENARIIRQAFDAAVHNTDLHLLRGVVDDAVGRVPRLVRAALRTLRANRHQPELDDVEVPEGEREVIDEGVSRVEAALERPEITQVFDSFDVSFAEQLERLAPQVEIERRL